MRSLFLTAVAAVVALGTAARAQTQVELKYPEGTSTTRVTRKFHQVLNIDGVDLKTDGDEALTLISTTGKRMPDGKVRVQRKREALRVHFDLPGGVQLVFDSAKPNNTSNLPQIQALLDAYRALAGSSYTLVIGKDNRVTAVEGADELLRTLSDLAARAFKGQLEADSLKREENQQATALPDQPVKPGDRWQRTEVMPVGGGQTLTFTTYYEYLGPTRVEGKSREKIGLFRGTVNYASAPDPAGALQVAGSELKIGSSSGTVLFDPESGQVTRSTSSVRITGTITFRVNGMDKIGKLDLAIDEERVLQ